MHILAIEQQIFYLIFTQKIISIMKHGPMESKVKKLHLLK